MNSREIITKTLEFKYPDRVGRSFEYGDGITSDIVYCSHTAKTFSTGWKKICEGKWERLDEWGNVWMTTGMYLKGEVYKGVLESTEDIYSYRFPDFSNPEDYSQVKEKRREYNDKWLLGNLPGFTFNIARNLFKLENYFVYLLLEKDIIHELHDKIDELLEKMIINYAKAGVDGIMFWEDWGTQNQTLISPDLWREEFFPRFKKLVSTAHNCGIKVFMHSCGAIGAIIPWLIEAGIDVLQFDQPALHGIDVLMSYQKKTNMTFWCPVDIQKTLQTKDESLIRGEAAEMIEKLWSGRGGFIAGYYGDNAALGLEPVWQEFACEEFLKRGRKELFIR